MNKLLFSSVITLVIATSCNNRTNTQFVGNKQVPIINNKDSRIALVGTENIIKGKEFCAFITQTNKDFKIIAAYIGTASEQPCDFSKSLVDTTLKTIDNCSIKLLVENDTGYFCTTPAITGKYIHRLAVLSIDNLSNYYLDTLELKYTSME
ncbi:MAG: hypothetical protein V4538_08645 [Bacteroidota bacterium]